jgi:methionine aminotransferase
MNKFEGSFVSKLPGVGTSIFAVMSQIANEHNAVNLSQGFPDFPVSEKLIDRIHFYMKKGMNQYAPMQGVPVLRQQIAEIVKELHGVKYDRDQEINIVAGATEGIYAIISAVVKNEDEVIIFEPAYDSYSPAIKLNGGIVKYAQLRLPDYHIDWEEVSRLISNRTRLIIINTPHNPSGSVLKTEDMQHLGEMIKGTDILVLSDEVYEHLIFDDLKHESACKYPDLVNRTFVVGSFGKTFHATGWKMGFVLAPQNLMTEFRKVHQFVVFTVNTPIQYAMADYLRNKKNYMNLGKFYEKKRNFFTKKIKKSKFKIVPSFGTYFQLLDYSEISDEKGFDFAVRLIKEYGIGSVPISSFYHDVKETKRLRFCFAKEKETLIKATEILCKI